MTTGSGTEAFTLRSVRRRLLSGSAWVFGARIASLLLGIVVQGILARLLTRSEYGVYASAFTLALLGAAIAQMGLDRAVVRFVAAAIGLGETGRARRAIRIAVGFGAVAAVGLGILAAAGPGRLLALDVFHSPELASLMPLVGGWIVANAVQSLLVESFRGLSRFAAATLLDALFVDVTSAGVFALLYASGRGAGPALVVAVVAGAGAMAAAVAAVLLMRRIRSFDGPGTIGRSEMFHVAWPLMVTNLAILLLGSGVDVLVLKAFEPASTVGLYAAASRLVVFVATPFVVFSGVIPPIIAELHAQGKMRQLERALRAGATLAGIPSFVILLVFVLFGPWVLQTIFGPRFRDASEILAILAIGRLVAVWAGSAGVTLMMTGNQRAMMTITLFSGLLSVGAGIAGAYFFGAIGVACATTAAQIVQNTLQLTLVRRRLGIWTMIHFSPAELYRYLRPGGKRGTAMEDAAEQVAEVLVEGEDEDEGSADPQD